MPQSGDIVLVDATSNLDRHDTKLFHFCPTPVGGLPLGTVSTTKEDEEKSYLEKLSLEEEVMLGRKL